MILISRVDVPYFAKSLIQNKEDSTLQLYKKYQQPYHTTFFLFFYHGGGKDIDYQYIAVSNFTNKKRNHTYQKAIKNSLQDVFLSDLKDFAAFAVQKSRIANRKKTKERRP